MFLLIESRQVVLRLPAQGKIALGIARDLVEHFLSLFVFAPTRCYLAPDEKRVELRRTVVPGVSFLESLLAVLVRLGQCASLDRDKGEAGQGVNDWSRSFILLSQSEGLPVILLRCGKLIHLVAPQTDIVEPVNSMIHGVKVLRCFLRFLKQSQRRIEGSHSVVIPRLVA